MGKATQYDRHKTIVLITLTRQFSASNSLPNQIFRMWFQAVENLKKVVKLKAENTVGKPKKQSASDEKYLKVTSLSDRSAFAQHLPPKYTQEVSYKTRSFRVCYPCSISSTFHQAKLYWYEPLRSGIALAIHIGQTDR